MMDDEAVIEVHPDFNVRTSPRKCAKIPNWCGSGPVRIRFTGEGTQKIPLLIKSQFLMIDGHTFLIHFPVKLYFGVIYCDVLMVCHYSRVSFFPFPINHNLQDVMGVGTSSRFLLCETEKHMKTRIDVKGYQGMILLFGHKLQLWPTRPLDCVNY